MSNLAAIGRVRASLSAAPPVTGSRAVLGSVSPDHTTALLIVNLNPRGEETLLKSSVGQVESRVAPLRSLGLMVKVSGPAGFSRDAVNVFASINGTLLLAFDESVLPAHRESNLCQRKELLQAADRGREHDDVADLP